MSKDGNILMENSNTTPCAKRGLELVISCQREANCKKMEANYFVSHRLVEPPSICFWQLRTS